MKHNQMDFKSQLIQRFASKGLAESSVALYVRALEKLNGINNPFTSLNFLKDHKAVMEGISHLKPNTQRSILIAIVSALSLFKGKPGVDALTKKYYDPMIEIRDKMRPFDEGHQKTPTQEENWVPWEDVAQKFSDLQQQVQVIKAMKTKEGNPDLFNILTDAVVLGLYATMPPRRNKDFYNMLVVEQYDPSTMSQMNILDYANRRFIFNDYKTQKTYGTQSVQIPEDLWEIIEVYIHKRGDKLAPMGVVRKKNGRVVPRSRTFKPFPFLEHFNGSHFSTNSITRILNRIFQRQISSSMLRHIFLSSKYGHLMEEQKTVAEGMGHSTSMQKAYIKQ